ncbi:MAG TPA: PDDEXK nuclease domain-containing protein [Pyrinomonadaceae bacterium]|nr:PDDEXK nuclease domain-containing protein [Pyrinomonadaceae bacterium]
MSEIITTEYKILLSDIKRRILDAQYQALKAVNKQLIALYWDIGKMIVEKQKGETWGKSVVENLAKDLRSQFPGISGFSARNIWRMRDFYLSYYQNEILTPLVAEIGWTHNLYIFERCKDDLEREFYIRWTKKFGWTKAILLHQIQNKTYEKTLLNQTNFDQTVSEDIRNQAKLAVKDEYTFDFLELGENYKERELERSLISKIEDFLREMGGIFAFVGSQHRLEIDGREFFIDLLLYHRRLRCLVAIELKIGEFQPEYVGKMQFYLAALDDLVKMPEENPSIGLILCQSKTKTIVEYALRESNKPIGISQYKISSELPEELKGELPEPEQIAKLLREN